MLEKPEDELTEDAHSHNALETAREASQGVDLFEDPDAALPATDLAEGSPGHEILTAQGLGLEPGDEDEHPLEATEE